jgi:hypothetical protein
MFMSHFVAITALLAQQTTAITAQSTPSQSDPEALAVVEKAITAMGGKMLWQQVGGAAAQAVTVSQTSPTRTVNWSDDWSTGRVRFRRDSADSETSTSSLIGTDASQVHVRKSGVSEPILHDNGVVVLAEGYPAAALILSLGKYGCSFHLGHPINPRVPLANDDPEIIAITERCPDPFYPQGAANLYWVFSQSKGLPVSVDLPVQGNTHHIVMSQKVDFFTFQEVQGLLVPQQLQIKRASGWVDQITVSKIAFVSGFPSAAFDKRK